MSLSTRTKVKPPTNLSVTYSVSANVIVAAKLAWSAPGNAWSNSYYVVYRDGEEIASSLTGLSYEDSAAATGGQYAYQVSTVNVHEFEGEPCVSAPLEVPSYPIWTTGWSLTIDQNTTASVATRAIDPDGLSLSYAKVGGTAPSTVTVNSAGVVTVLSTAGGGYTLGIRASNGTLTSDTTISLTVNAAATAPNPPINFVATPVSSSQINLSWAKATSGPDPDDYDADIYTTGTGGWTALTPLSGPAATSYSATGLTSNTQYFFRVMALNGGLASSYTTTNATTLQSTSSRDVYYTATFNNGSVAASGDLLDGGRFACKFQPEGGVNTWTDQVTNGTSFGGMSNSNLDSRVITTSETFQGETITPRRGAGFFRQALYYDKEYECMNNSSSGANDQLDKPRTFFSLNATPYRHDFDREVWLGFSIYVRANHVHDIGTRAHQGGCNLMNITAGGEESPQFTLKTFARFNTNPGNYTGGLGGNTEHYMLWYGIRANSPAEPNKTAGSQFTYYADLGDVADDEGMWTDWVFRYRLNPFTTTTNASSVGGKNHSYQGNKGILQIWKSTGPYLNANNDRAMTKVFNIYNGPIGLVPHPTGLLNLRFDLYKYGWKKNTTTNTGAIYYGFDELRFGFRVAPEAGEVISQSGTKDIDVNPSGNSLSGWSEQV